MKVSAPSPLNPIDANSNGMIGKALNRVDGPLKVSGQATYAYEYFDGGQPAFGFVLTSPIAKGSILFLDTSDAEAMAGVLHVMTYKNAPRQGSVEEKKANPQLNTDQISHHGQVVALVVAETFEQARAAAFVIDIRYKPEEGQFILNQDAMDNAKKPKAAMQPTDSSVGDFEAAFAKAPVKLDVTYTTPHQSHAMMEPHATLAVWEDDKLTVYTANQIPSKTKESLADTLRISKNDVRIVSRYVGGGFGGKLWLTGEAVLAALAAKAIKRPVKLAFSRPQVFSSTTHRSNTVQKIRLGATPDGKLTAIAHEAWSENTGSREGYENAADQTRALYAAPDRLTSHRLAALDLPWSDSMRAPGEAVGLLAIECAMDELAEKLNIDPIQLRLLNEPAEDPEKKIPFSTRNLVGCLKEGAKTFGWDKRLSSPSSRREGRWLIGMGVASAIRGNPLSEAHSKVRLGPDGVLTVRMASTDIGTGSYTIFTQIAAELLGLPEGQIVMLLGDSAFPETQGSGGSWAAGSQGSALYEACMNLRLKLLKKAKATETDASAFKDGNLLLTDGRHFSIAELAGAEGLEAEGELQPGSMIKKYSQFSFGAHFAEVGVDSDTGEIRLRRMQSFFAAGRILNAKTARSQALGGMTFGIGAALMEEIVVDRHTGNFVNHDLAEYHVPVNGDVPALEATYLPEVDDKANPLKTKGVGELGVCGAGAAIANAIYNASGVRIRDYPLTLDKVLKGWSV